MGWEIVDLKANHQVDLTTLEQEGHHGLVIELTEGVKQ